MTDFDPVKVLVGVELFGGLAPDALQRLAARAVVLKYQAGRTIPADGPDGLALQIVLDGEAAVIVDGSTDHTLRAGDHFGEISVLDGEPRTATVAAISHLQTLVVPREVVRELVAGDAGFARRLMVMLCARLRAADPSI